MKFCVFLFIFFVSGTNAWGRGDLEKYGPFQLALRSKLIKCDHNKSLDLDVIKTNVYFYDFSNDDIRMYPIDDAARGILSIPGLDKSRKFFMFVAGFKSNIYKNTEQTIRDAFTDLPDSYLLILDHYPYTNANDGNIKSYERAVKYVYYIGKAIANMLVGLKEGGISPKQMYCIGHSLGAQMLGYAGDLFSIATGNKIARITALDPAGPCFSNSLIEDQVRSGEADYVEVYHCNAGGLGTTSVLGDIDFFINKKGQSQPNCGTPLIPGIFDSSKAARCNHRSCIQVWAATINDPNLFMAQKCDSYKMFKDGSCSRNDVTVAGFWNPGTAKGVYYFKTEGFKIE